MATSSKRKASVDERPIRNIGQSVGTVGTVSRNPGQIMSLCGFCVGTVVGTWSADSADNTVPTVPTQCRHFFRCRHCLNYWQIKQVSESVPTVPTLFQSFSWKKDAPSGLVITVFLFSS